MRLAIWQGISPASDLELALADARRALKAASAMGADALVLPEVWWPGYNQPTVPELAQPQGGPFAESLRLLCAQTSCALVIGYVERGGDEVYNAALVIGPDGQDLSHYRKIQLYGPREAQLYKPGDSYAIFNIGGVRAAALICYDVEFAPHIAALAAQGVQVILAPTANMVPFDHVTRYTVPAMAANHGVTIAYANYCGTEGDLTYVGGSLIVGPHGEVLAQAGQSPALLIADIPPRDPARLSTQSRDLRKI
jgi:predicted amidohydrolase